MSDARADCVFFRIADHREPASHVYEDDRVIAFMDIRPVNTGHTLVIPKQHASSLAELLDGDGVALWRAGTRVAAAVRRSGVRCEGIDLLLADGAAAGQEVFHVHLHVLPRFAGDGFGFRFPEGYAILPERAAIDDAAARVRSALDRA